MIKKQNHLSIYQLNKLKLKHITAGLGGACLKQVAKLGKMVTFSERVPLNLFERLYIWLVILTHLITCQMKHFQQH